MIAALGAPGRKTFSRLTKQTSSSITGSSHTRQAEAHPTPVMPDENNKLSFALCDLPPRRDVYLTTTIAQGALC